MWLFNVVVLVVLISVLIKHQTDSVRNSKTSEHPLFTFWLAVIFCAINIIYVYHNGEVWINDNVVLWVAVYLSIVGIDVLLIVWDGDLNSIAWVEVFLWMFVGLIVSVVLTFVLYYGYMLLHFVIMKMSQDLEYLSGFIPSF